MLQLVQVRRLENGRKKLEGLSHFYRVDLKRQSNLNNQNSKQ